VLPAESSFQKEKNFMTTSLVLTETLNDQSCLDYVSSPRQPLDNAGD
jgi:hypothetical protein